MFINIYSNFHVPRYTSFVSRLKALEHKWNKMTNICPEENKYAEIMWCMSKLFIHQWEEARNTLRLSGSDDGQIVHVLGHILKVFPNTCTEVLNTFSAEHERERERENAEFFFKYKCIAFVSGNF